MDYAHALTKVILWADDHGVRVELRSLGREQVGVFDGVSVTLNDAYAAHELTYYLTHALGSIVIWSRDHAVQAMFDKLRSAKANNSDTVQLEAAIAGYERFEVESSAFAVGLLRDVGLETLEPQYTNFMRADLAAMTVLHRTGQAPVWADFFAQWNDDVAAGRVTVQPFQTKAISSFTPVLIERQEILQKQK